MHNRATRPRRRARLVSDRTLHLCAAFGLSPALAVRAPRPNTRLARQLADSRAKLTLITGPSGAGKSLLIDALAREARRRGIRLVRVAAAPTLRRARAGPNVQTGTRTVVDRLGLPLGQAVRVLAWSGLAEARLMARRVDRLSAGERARFEIARAWSVTLRTRAPGRGDPASDACWVVADEFLALLDRPTAAACAAALSRSLRRNDLPARWFVATSHADLARALRPDVIVRVREGGTRTLRANIRSGGADDAS